MKKNTEMIHGEVKRGTKVICYLKEDQSEFLNEVGLVGLHRIGSTEWPM